MKNKIKKQYIIIMERRIGTDKYSRKKEDDAKVLYRMLKDLYPNAKLEYKEEEIIC